MSFKNMIKHLDANTTICIDTYNGAYKYTTQANMVICSGYLYAVNTRVAL